jgi:hypothetical protein
MNTLTTKLIAAGLLFIFTLLSGLWLSHSGKPYNSGIFAIHKLIALATIIMIGISVFNLYKALDLQTFVVLVLIAASGLLFLALLITGGLLSLNISLSGIALKVHQVVPLLALVASAITISLLIRANS